MSAVNTLLSSACTANVAPIPVPEAEQQVVLIFDKIIEQSVPEVKHLIRTKKAKKPIRLSTGSREFRGRRNVLASDSGSNSFTVISRSSSSTEQHFIASSSLQHGDDVLQLEAGMPDNVEVVEVDEGEVAVGSEQDQLLHNIATRIGQIGDQYNERGGQPFEAMQEQLVGILSGVGLVSYEVFAATLNDVIGQDRNIAQMALVMRLGRTVISRMLPSADTTVSYFRHFVCDAFSNALASQGGLENFVNVTEGNSSDGKADAAP